MDQVKKILGIVWILLALVVAYYGLTMFGIPKIMSDKQDDNVFGWIILTVLMPIIVGGLGIFGWYSFTGEYADKNI
ncbi:DUF6814 family protein [Kaistella antarctica]|uniref:Uncharacterized protein n=1 Tax=Kaistella antarctica TaxID=266748 RepID=A0A448NN73_9FLAO|nr:hypothetical protein [Kaistella antarctica]KEY19853.1 hypothetical protein HY04_01095 [Kaistella antarctica]SEV96805.1 hypothetical protein SAMN05421765_1556 [Kaistella antarctica]VEH96302.1 Uncharacterised protein [Kaistella antarctica]